MTETTGNLQYGTDTLEVISSASNFNRWMYETIKPHCKGKILEIGSGIGNISQFFVEEGAEITLSDFDTNYFPRLEEKFGSSPNMMGIHKVDFSVGHPEETYPHLIGQFDTVFALNVVEHIEDHYQALKNAHLFLRPGGNVVILVPAFQFLFNGFDRQLGHYRRYTQKSLKTLMESAGFKVIHSQYFNFIGTLGWYVSGNILRKQMIPGGQMKFYDTLVPLWKMVDFFTYRFSGLSVIQAGQKK
jgi:SAM-dependent methyltransferase